MLTKRLIRVIAVLLILAAGAAASPQLIDYQGFLKNTGGNPVTDTVSITFTIYTASTGGTSKWSEAQNNVSVVGGLFNVTLGSSTAIPDTVFNQSDRWLAVSIGGSELSPRTRIAASAYAMRVNTVDRASGGVVAGALTASQGNFGANNSNYGTQSFVAGDHCEASGEYSSVGGGRYNSATSPYSVVCGGGGPNLADSNRAYGDYSVVCGGRRNIARSHGAFVGAGWANMAYWIGDVVVGGDSNWADTWNSVVVGGHANYSYLGSSVLGGRYDSAKGGYSVVVGGSWNKASGDNSAVGGGSACRATAQYATVPGGYGNQANGQASFAIGDHAQANHRSSFVWCDSTTGSFFSSTADDQFSVRSSGGVRFFTNKTATAGVTLAAGASAWQSVSDSTLKQNIRVVDGATIMSNLMRLPIKQWSYKAQSPDIEHIGPMAQDFYAIFKLGDDDKTISTIDPAGIALAAIQELYRAQQRLQQKTAEIDNLKTELAELRSAVNRILAARGNGVIRGDLALTQTSKTVRSVNGR
ncbi:hypothetical protein C3F09_06660 [candidate division GN15 bacterium]|uniref:Peptidase S74 domain-containing protein n=1 Tax=candidate division GN15 bacterium TaxID=2072418 RepID=A0A855X6V6_9BACT|nr:MAG: hypothetical protein C3F09_06660 [candidate division GN15 bacterium]